MKPTKDFGLFGNGVKPNVTYKGTLPNSSDLPVHVINRGEDNMICVSCWELSDEELAQVIKSKRVFMFSFGIQAHVSLSTDVTQ